VRGEKHTTSGGSNVYIDAVLSSEATAEPSFGSGGGPAKAQRMIFAYPRREPYVDASGNAWLPATEFVVRAGHHTDPVALTWWTEPAAEPVSNTPDPELYRYGVHAPEFWVNVTVAPGVYTVRLKFAERRVQTDPTRVPISVQINGQEVIQSLDVATQAGGFNRPMDLTLDEIRPKNGIIEIRFMGADGGEATIQALEVIPSANGARKVE